MNKLNSVLAIIAMSTVFLTGCPKKQDDAKDTAAPKPTETTPAADPTKTVAPDPKVDPKVDPSGKAAAATGELPAECTEYKALADKLAAPQCDKLGAQRDTLKASFESSWKAWAALPAADRASAADACKAAAQGLKTAAAAACGW
ncbi:MAG: hypothetical protein H6Q90_3845 [Deltaproteobacteria bacterium]|nr:hypothetical protein [Deltaproteobacteria bacterium]